MDKLLDWIEAHRVTVDIIQWIILLVLAYLTGLFRIIRKYTIKPKLEIIPTASVVFVENIEQHENLRNLIRASFIINAGFINRTTERIVLDKFYLTFETENYWRSYKQKLLRIAFPSRPREVLGTGIKYMGVFFTEYSNEEGKCEVITGELEPKDMCGGYLLFVSFTCSDWNPKIINGRIKVRLNGVLTTGETITSKAALRIEQSRDLIEELVPGLSEHVAHESTWNHDLSILK